MNSSGIPTDTPTDSTGSFYDYKLIYTSATGYSAVYKAKKNNKYFALKAIKKELGNTTRYNELLKREFDIMSNVQSPYCVECWDLITDSNIGLCIVMQYVDGVTLTEWTKEQHSNAEKQRVLLEILDAVSDLHNLQIIHQDIKPDNIIITKIGAHVKLIDLGLSDNDTYIQKGRGFTDEFASPEQKAGSQSGISDDIWALGHIIDALFPNKYSNVKKKCRKHNPNKRYKSVTEIKRAITAYRKWVAPVIIIVSLLIILLILSAVIYPKYTRAIEKLQTIDSLTILTNSLDSANSRMSVVIAEYEAQQNAASEKDRFFDSVHQQYDKVYNKWMNKVNKMKYSEAGAFVFVDYTKELNSVYETISANNPKWSKDLTTDYENYRTVTCPQLSEKVQSKPTINSLLEEGKISQEEADSLHQLIWDEMQNRY